MAGDGAAVAALETIYAEEVHHVAYGSNGSISSAAGLTSTPRSPFTRWCSSTSMAALKPPFNEEKRAQAGLPPDFYWPLADG